ncbi:MAG TPA: M23 family metallopeptidase [Anaerolineales bacterium]|nr:M23 family metallopeptidase [Anaerolineales bacterium]HRF48524.1 M23 family metallopeptidase [Anaerolineales bacterium]
MRILALVGLAVLITLGLSSQATLTAMAQPEVKPFGLPFDTAPGPSTWLLGQLYGNTTGAYRTRVIWYGAGQGLHFGLDFPARCGTPVVAIGDGVVVGVDELARGAGPHNLLIRHGDSYVSLYGHLFERPNLAWGQVVTRGQVIGVTGDPDLTCTSRPHLHLEIRSINYGIAYNPVNLIDADWDSLMLAAPFGRGFARDLTDPRRWQYAEDQPDVQFGGPLLNDYDQPWPPDWRP